MSSSPPSSKSTSGDIPSIIKRIAFSHNQKLGMRLTSTAVVKSVGGDGQALALGVARGWRVLSVTRATSNVVDRISTVDELIAAIKRSKRDAIASSQSPKLSGAQSTFFITFETPGDEHEKSEYAAALSLLSDSVPAAPPRRNARRLPSPPPQASGHDDAQGKDTVETRVLVAKESSFTAASGACSPCGSEVSLDSASQSWALPSPTSSIPLSPKASPTQHARSKAPKERTKALVERYEKLMASPTSQKTSPEKTTSVEKKTASVELAGITEKAGKRDDDDDDDDDEDNDDASRLATHGKRNLAVNDPDPSSANPKELQEQNQREQESAVRVDAKSAQTHNKEAGRETSMHEKEEDFATTTAAATAAAAAAATPVATIDEAKREDKNRKSRVDVSSIQHDDENTDDTHRDQEYILPAQNKDENTANGRSHYQFPPSPPPTPPTPPPSRAFRHAWLYFVAASAIALVALVAMSPLLQQQSASFNPAAISLHSTPKIPAVTANIERQDERKQGGSLKIDRHAKADTGENGSKAPIAAPPNVPETPLSTTLARVTALSRAQYTGRPKPPPSCGRALREEGDTITEFEIIERCDTPTEKETFKRNARDMEQGKPEKTTRHARFLQLDDRGVLFILANDKERTVLWQSSRKFARHISSLFSSIKRKATKAFVSPTRGNASESQLALTTTRDTASVQEEAGHFAARRTSEEVLIERILSGSSAGSSILVQRIPVKRIPKRFLDSWPFGAEESH